ncbi:hypothetical protein CPB84DRAFT_1795416 [Gymnopilus junonius]|uniref:F-box domain-containing protein n=1 Tax=Gymnopilus junonius TaxID=109634 RepID=A0A9P5TG84_GYMJU|nr:hypothetical protein CPB84DRAFT_1795416 [Gymnopilus junonius]
MDQLPVELHIKILSLLPSIFLQTHPLSDYDIRLPSLFPFNVASVCTQWLTIISQIPECWIRVVFDVAKEPAPFLDAFAWSNDLEKIEVLVFTSSTDDGEEYRKSEKQRSFAIAQALRPHIHRCKSITFDLTYSTSLPPSHIFFLQDMPCLEALVLECVHDDIQVKLNPWMTTAAKRPNFGSKFHSLRKLSLTGFSFLYLALHLASPASFRQFNFNRLMELYISRFSFLESGHYTAENFLLYLSYALRKGSHSLYLRNLSLSYNYENSTTCPLTNERLLPRNLLFHSVTKNFLNSFYATADIFCISSLTIKECEIPTNLRREHFKAAADYLVLDGIVDDERGSGMRHILDICLYTFSGKLKICACRSFNDSLLEWLQTNKSPNTFPIEHVNSIHIHDCPTFTPITLRNFVKVRNALPIIDFLYRIDRTVVELFVTGKGPSLTKEDKGWFLGQSHTTIKWITENDEGIREEFYAPIPSPLSVQYSSQL